VKREWIEAPGHVLNTKYIIDFKKMMRGYRDEADNLTYNWAVYALVDEGSEPGCVDILDNVTEEEADETLQRLFNHLT